MVLQAALHLFRPWLWPALAGHDSPRKVVATKSWPRLWSRAVAKMRWPQLAQFGPTACESPLHHTATTRLQSRGRKDLATAFESMSCGRGWWLRLLKTESWPTAVATAFAPESWPGAAGHDFTRRFGRLPAAAGGALS